MEILYNSFILNIDNLKFLLVNHFKNAVEAKRFRVVLLMNCNKCLFGVQRWVYWWR